MATDMAVVRISYSTMFSKMPVSVGTIAEPKKKTNQMQVKVKLTDVKNGIGNENSAAKDPIITQRPKDSFEL